MRGVKGDRAGASVMIQYRPLIVLAGALLLPGIPLSAGADQSSLKNDSSGCRITREDAGRIVTLHNKVRAEVGVGPLRWSEQLAGYAQQWADHLVSSRCGMAHRPRTGEWRQEYGENLFMGTARQYNSSDAVMAWAKEKGRYNGEALQVSRWAGAGHYTQMVWRDTEQIGCATGECKGSLIVVCNYDPPGNILGRNPY